MPPSLCSLHSNTNLHLLTPQQRPGAAHPLRTHLPDGAQQPIRGGVCRDKTTSLGDGAGISDEALYPPPPTASGRRRGHGQGQCSSRVHSTLTTLFSFFPHASSSDPFWDIQWESCSENLRERVFWLVLLVVHHHIDTPASLCCASDRALRGSLRTLPVNCDK